MMDEKHRRELLLLLLNTADHYERTDSWEDRTEDEWFVGLLEEVAELGGSLRGMHEHPEELELLQICSLAFNWLSRFYNLFDIKEAISEAIMQKELRKHTTPTPFKIGTRRSRLP